MKLEEFRAKFMDWSGYTFPRKLMCVFAIASFFFFGLSVSQTCSVYAQPLPDTSSHALGAFLNGGVAIVSAFFGQVEVAAPTGALALTELSARSNAIAERDRILQLRDTWMFVTIGSLVVCLLAVVYMLFFDEINSTLSA